MRILSCFFLGLLGVLVIGSECQANNGPVAYDAARNRIIAYMLGHQLPAQHFAHKPLDDSLSQVAFDLYLRQLDPRKRFLLQSDVTELGAFADHVDDELKQGRIVLADAGAEIFNDRVKAVEKMIDPLLAKGFDLNREDYLEGDAKKLTFAVDKTELEDRWRRILKMQVLDKYFDSLDEQKEKENAEKKESSAVAKDLDQAKMKETIEAVGKRNHRYLSRLLEQDRQDHYNRYFDAVARAFDPHTNYMPPTSKEDFDIHMSGSLEGIGALLREDDGQIKVVRIIPGSAAEIQGELQAEDTILAVSEKKGEPVEITDMRIREAVSYIRGPKGTEVHLTVLKPDGSRPVIAITRDVVKIEETYVKSTILKAEESPLSIGYIRIPSFYRDFSGNREGAEGRNVTDDTRVELLKLKEQGIGGLILDLRNNGGGALTDAVDISGLFLPGGPVVQVKNSQGMIRVLEDEDAKVVYDGPVIVLVNKFSASASEILAAALQDYGRAFIVGGAHTHGKGTVQALVDMNKNLPLLHLKKYDDLGALKLTIQKFYRINGESTQFKGVEPDLVVPSMLDYLESGEQYMENSLPWDQVETIDFNRWNGQRFSNNDAMTIGAKWVKQNEPFQKIKQEASRAKERSENTRVAVFLEGMKLEREELERARREAESIGMGNVEEDNSGTAEGKKKSLGEELEFDPFVQLSLFLMKDVRFVENAVGGVQ